MFEAFSTFFSTPDFNESTVKFVKKIIKLLVIAFLFFGLAFGGCFYFFAPRPPKEAKLLQNFNEHRAAFEQLRDMLQADTNLTRIAGWGVETRKPFFLGYPPGGGFSVDRFNKYLALFKDIGALGAGRNEGNYAAPTILVWTWGWAGNTKHICICWLEEQPTNQIPTLDGYRGQSVYPNTVVAFKRIDQQWYLRADW